MSYASDTKQLVELERRDDVLRGGIPTTAFNFINSIIGSGIIGITYKLSFPSCFFAGQINKVWCSFTCR